MTPLLTYCHAAEMPRCATCQRFENLDDLAELPAAERKSRLKEAFQVNREHCEMNRGVFFVPDEGVTA